MEGINSNMDSNNSVFNVNLSGDDSFYSYKSNDIVRQEPVDWGIHDEGSVPLPNAGTGGGFQVIICVDGEPYYANIQGSIGAAVT